MLREERTEDEKKSTLGYQTITDIRLPPRKNIRVIYHPNGCIPYEPMETGGSLVFSENEYADQLIGAMSGQYSPLIQHFLQNTCLFLGLSLEDATLKHLLRQVARLNPGHCHYYVQHYKEGKEWSQHKKDAFFASNFETYNLVTLFLCDNEIASLGKLIERGFGDENKDSEISYLAHKARISLVYCYYIVGAIGVGKSTSISHFRDLATYDEWFEQRTLELGREPEKLKEDIIKELDEWIAGQFSLKNWNMLQEGSGIILADRCPLDPISFTPYDGWSAKAKFLLQNVNVDNVGIMSGQIILLLDEPAVLAIRLEATDKEYSEERLCKLQNDLKKIYNIDGVTTIDAQYMSLDEIVKDIARIIHTEDYRPIDVQNRLVEIKKGGSNV